jgi:LysR family transcriptional regulator, glycine cleavage system transcriptional activator
MPRRRLPSLNALQAFEAAGRHGRMTLAADELSVTHGAVSRQVRHLEAVLGVSLFEGPKHALRLTDAGRALLVHLTTALDMIDAGVRAVREENEGILDVSCLGTFMLRWLIPRLHRFQNQRPGIEVRLRASDSSADFAQESHGVAIRVTDHPLPHDALVTELFAETVGPVLSPVLAAAMCGEGLDRFAGLTLLHTRTRPHAWTAWAARNGQDDVEQLAGTEFEHFYFMLEAATAGLGVCIAPWPLIIDDFRSGRLVAPFGFEPSGQSYVAVRRNQHDRKAQAFCEWLRSEAERTPPPPVHG